MRKFRFAIGAGLSLIAAGSVAQSSSDSERLLTLDEVIVTGSARAERRFDVSYAVNSLDNEDVQKLAPLNFSDLLGQLPGFGVEATGGEIQNIYRVRGIPSRRSRWPAR